MRVLKYNLPRVSSTIGIQTTALEINYKCSAQKGLWQRVLSDIFSFIICNRILTLESGKIKVPETVFIYWRLQVLLLPKATPLCQNQQIYTKTCPCFTSPHLVQNVVRNDKQVFISFEKTVLLLIIGKKNLQHDSYTMKSPFASQQKAYKVNLDLHGPLSAPCMLVVTNWPNYSPLLLNNNNSGSQTSYSICIRLLFQSLNLLCYGERVCFLTHSFSDPGVVTLP